MTGAWIHVVGGFGTHALGVCVNRFNAWWARVVVHLLSVVKESSVTTADRDRILNMTYETDDCGRLALSLAQILPSCYHDVLGSPRTN